VFSRFVYFVAVSTDNFLVLCSGANDPTKADPNLFVPFVDNKRLSKSVRKFFRFGVPKLLKDYTNCSYKNEKVTKNHDEKESCKEKLFNDDDGSQPEKESVLWFSTDKVD